MLVGIVAGSLVTYLYYAFMKLLTNGCPIVFLVNLEFRPKLNLVGSVPSLITGLTFLKSNGGLVNYLVYVDEGLLSGLISLLLGLLSANLEFRPDSPDRPETPEPNLFNTGLCSTLFELPKLLGVFI